MLVAAALALGVTPVAAQTAAKGHPACQKYVARGDDASAAQCEYNEFMRASKQRTKDAEERSAKAQAETARALTGKACADVLLAGIAAGKWKRDALLDEAGGKFTDDNVCPIARKRGF